MEEAPKRKTIFRRLSNLTRFPRLRRNQSGQAFMEYILVLILAVVFLRFVFFNRDYGFKASLDRTMLRLGSYLEANLKTGAKPGGDGTKSLEAFAGTKAWKN
jgi:hypothetical protein